MLPQIETFIKDVLPTKTNWGSKELISKLMSLNQSISHQLKNDGNAIVIESSKKIKVDLVKKYDILYLVLIGSPHYFLVHNVTDEMVSGIVITSKNKPSHSIHQIIKDRFFNGSFGTCTYLTIPIEEAKDSFVRVFESKSEADEIFRKMKDHYKTVLKLK